MLVPWRVHVYVNTYILVCIYIFGEIKYDLNQFPLHRNLNFSADEDSKCPRLLRMCGSAKYSRSRSTMGSRPNKHAKPKGVVPADASLDGGNEVKTQLVMFRC